MRLIISVLSVTWCCLSMPFTAAAEFHSKSSTGVQKRELQSSNNTLSPDDLIACVHKLTAGIDAFYPDAAPESWSGLDSLINKGPTFDEQYEIFKRVFTRTYCEDAVEYLYDLSVTSNYTERTLLDDAKVVIKEHRLRRQRALIVSLGKDQDSPEFYPPSGGGYDSFTAGVSLGDCPNRFREGCSTDGTAIVMSVYIAARGAHLISETVECGDPLGICGTVATAVALVTAIVQEAAQVVLDFYTFVDSYTGGAEQSIANANVKILLKNQALIFDKFSIDGTLTTRRQRLTRSAEEGDTPNLKLNTYLRGYGCDGIDNDNDNGVDDCAEDVFPATLVLSDSGFCSSKYFLSEAGLRACVEQYLVAHDDCDAIAAIEAVSAPGATCASTTLTYRASTQHCSANTVQKTFGPFKLDLDAPALGTLNCPTDPLPHTLEMVDLGPLGIVATDDCGIDTITVTVTSDETTSSVNAQIYKEVGQDYGIILRAQSLTPDMCNPLETNCDQICFDGRSYRITVETTDVAGRSASQSCVVNIELPEAYAPSDCGGRVLKSVASNTEQPHVLAVSDALYQTQKLCAQAEHFRLLDLGGSGLTPPAGYGCNGIDDNCDELQQIDECAEDVYGPTIDSEVVSTEIRETWFTNEAALLALLQRTVEISDDCGLATYTNISLMSACQNSSVKVEIEDRCGNPATQVIPVWFDPTPPTIQASLANSLWTHSESKGLYVDVGLSRLSSVIFDTCDPTPSVEIEVFSDELPLGPPGKSLPIVQLVRQYTRQDKLFTGWRVDVSPKAAKTCDGKWHLCEEADGRVYTIRVCATNSAGLRTCQELEVEVPVLVKKSLGAPSGSNNWKKGGRELTSKVNSATSQGKLFLIQSDSAKLNAI